MCIRDRSRCVCVCACLCLYGPHWSDLMNWLIDWYILPSVIYSYLTWAKLSQDLLDRFSQFFFHQMKDICVTFYRSGPLFRIPQRMLPWQPILGKICEMPFIQHTGISKRISIDCTVDMLTEFKNIGAYKSVNYKRTSKRNNTAEWKSRRGRSNKDHYRVEIFVVLDFAMYKL